MSRCPSLISSVQSPGSATLGNSATLQQGMAEGKHFFVEIASRITSDEPKIADFPGFALNTGDARSAEAKAFLATWQRSETFSCATWQWNFAMVDVFYEGWRSSFSMVRLFSSAIIPIGKFFFGVGCVSESVLRLSPRAERPRRCLFGGVFLGMFRGSV